MRNLWRTILPWRSSPRRIDPVVAVDHYAQTAQFFADKAMQRLEENLDLTTQVRDLRIERDALKASVDRVRALHRPVEKNLDDEDDSPTVTVCAECDGIAEPSSGAPATWRCATIAALEEKE